MQKHIAFLTDEKHLPTGCTEEITIPTGHWITDCDPPWEKKSRDVPRFVPVGLGAEKIVWHLLESEKDGKHWLAQSAAPFAVLAEKNPKRPETRAMWTASQVQPDGSEKELRVERHPRFHRGAFGWRWVKLEELARFLKLEISKLWDTYFEVTDSSYATHAGWTKIYSMLGAASLDIAVDDLQTVQSAGLYDHPELARIWVPAGWAMPVCILSELGYRPQ